MAPSARAQEAVAAEAAGRAYASGWYRTVRMDTWLWEGADRAVLEAALDRIAGTAGERRWDHRADTLVDYGPGHWVFELSATGDSAFARGERSEKEGDTDGARRHFVQAAIYYTIASYPHLRDEPSRQALAKAFEAYRRAGRLLARPLEEWRFTVDGVPFSAFVHLPKASGDPLPVVLKTGGMDVLSTEFFPLYQRFADTGIAMITFDMPGTGNLGVVGADADKHHVAVLERVIEDPRFDASRVAVWSASLGGMPAVKVAITQQDRLAAVVSGCGLVHAVHAFELGGSAPPGLADMVEAYAASHLTDAQIEEIEAGFRAEPELAAQRDNFQFEVYVDRVRANPDSMLDLVSKSRPVSLVVQGLLGRGVVTDVPILSVNTHADPLVPQSDSLLATDASKYGTLMLFGHHEGHCVARTVANDPIIDWLVARLGEPST